MCDFTLVLSVHELKEDPCFLKALTTYLFDEICHMILFSNPKIKDQQLKKRRKNRRES